MHCKNHRRNEIDSFNKRVKDALELHYSICHAAHRYGRCPDVNNIRQDLLLKKHSKTIGHQHKPIVYQNHHRSKLAWTKPIPPLQDTENAIQLHRSDCTKEIRKFSSNVNNTMQKKLLLKKQSKTTNIRQVFYLPYGLHLLFLTLLFAEVRARSHVLGRGGVCSISGGRWSRCLLFL